MVATSGTRYTTVDVYPEDREKAKAAKQDGESWSEFFRRAGEKMDAPLGAQRTHRPDKTDPRSMNIYPDDLDIARGAKGNGETWSDFLRRAADQLDPDT